MGWGRDRKARAFHAADAGRSRDDELPGFSPTGFNDDRVAAIVVGSRRMIGLAAPTTHAAFNSACTFGHGSGARFLNGVQSASDMRVRLPEIDRRSLGNDPGRVELSDRIANHPQRSCWHRRIVDCRSAAGQAASTRSTRARRGAAWRRAHTNPSATTMRPAPSTSQPGRIGSKSNALCSTLSGEMLA